MCTCAKNRGFRTERVVEHYRGLSPGYVFRSNFRLLTTVPVLLITRAKYIESIEAYHHPIRNVREIVKRWSGVYNYGETRPL